MKNRKLGFEISGGMLSTTIIGGSIAAPVLIASNTNVRDFLKIDQGTNGSAFILYTETNQNYTLGTISASGQTCTPYINLSLYSMAQAKDYTFKITAKCLDNESLSASYVFKLTRNQSDDVITGIEISGNETTKKTIEYKENTGKLYLNNKDGFVSATVKGNGNFKSQVQWKNITDDDYKAALIIDEQPSENSDVIEPYIKLDYPTIQNNAQYIFKL